MVEALAALTCSRVILANRGWAVRQLAICIITGVAALGALTWFIAATEPLAPTITGHDQRTLANGSVMLTIQMHAVLPRWCTYQTSFFIYGDDPEMPGAKSNHHEFYLLGGSVNDGRSNFSSEDFEVPFVIPMGLPAGRWFFIRRARFWCEPLGLVPHWQQTEPIEVDLP